MTTNHDTSTGVRYGRKRGAKRNALSHFMLIGFGVLMLYPLI